MTEPTAGPLFDGAARAKVEPDHLPTGTLYVLRSRSLHPTIAAHRDLIHKIGITGGSVEARIADGTLAGMVYHPHSAALVAQGWRCHAGPGQARCFDCAAPFGALGKSDTCHDAGPDGAGGVHRGGGAALPPARRSCWPTAGDRG